MVKQREMVKDREAWRAAVKGAAKSWTRLRDWQEQWWDRTDDFKAQPWEGQTGDKQERKPPEKEIRWEGSRLWYGCGDEEREPDENPALVSRPSTHLTFSVSSRRSQGPAFPCSTKEFPAQFCTSWRRLWEEPHPLSISGFSSQSLSILMVVNTPWTFVVSSKELKN